jgi:hypothetical protein
LLKFGSEKGRLAIFITAGLMVLIFCVAEKIAKSFDFDWSSLLNRLSTMNHGTLIFGAIMIAGLVTLLSSQISISIMKNKEF